jgi:hypothetical protein
MLKILKPQVFVLAFALAVTFIPQTQPQQKKEVLPAPLPQQIIKGKKVFISYAGGDSNGLYSGGSERLYNQFYAAMKDWGRYQLIDSPADADLVFEIGFSNPVVGESIYGRPQAGHAVK